MVSSPRCVHTLHRYVANVRIRDYPNVHFIVVINPNSGPGGRRDLPDEHYQRAVPRLQAYDNVTLLGYVHASYGGRKMKIVQKEVDTYWRWEEQSKGKKTGSMGLDGIFVDEVESGGQCLEYFETLSRYIKKKHWRSGKSGISLCSPR